MAIPPVLLTARISRVTRNERDHAKRASRGGLFLLSWVVKRRSQRCSDRSGVTIHAGRLLTSELCRAAHRVDMFADDVHG